MANTRPLGILLIALIALPAIAAERETIDLIPAERSGWTPGRLFAPITGLFLGGPSYWYGERAIAIDTRPEGASLDLFYVRENVQRRFERATSPILLRLPSRIDTGPRDSISIRATLAGYRNQEVQIDVRSRETRMSIELSPLPYRLEAIAHTHLARRDSLKFLTTGPARFRLRNVAGGISITLADSSHSDGAFENAREASSNNVESIRAEQLGEDVLVSVRLRESPGSDLDIRSTQDYDASRDLHRFTVELVPPGGNAATLAASSGALARVRHSEVFGCALDFDRSMREQLDPQALSRALAPTSDFVDAHLRLALVRLGELSPDGLIALVDGARFRPANPLDLAAASAQSAEAIGFLSLLRAFVEQLEPIEQRRSALRGVVAPELDSERFDTLFEIAEALEDRCEEKTRSAGS